MRGAQTSAGLAFADLLRRHRASARMTQEDLASRTGLTPQAIGLLERGERRRPHAYTVQVLGKLLGSKNGSSPSSRRRRVVLQPIARPKRPPFRHFQRRLPR